MADNLPPTGKEHPSGFPASSIGLPRYVSGSGEKHGELMIWAQETEKMNLVTSWPLLWKYFCRGQLGITFIGEKYWRCYFHITNSTGSEEIVGHRPWLTTAEVKDSITHFLVRRKRSYCLSNVRSTTTNAWAYWEGLFLGSTTVLGAD